MAVVTVNATQRGLKTTVGFGMAADVKCKVGYAAVGSSDSVNSAYTFFNIPTRARILGVSRLRTTDLASSGSPTLDVGLFSVNNNITSSDNCLATGVDISVVVNQDLVLDITKQGQRAWEFISGLTADPTGEVTVKATIKSAAVNTAGSIAIELFYVID